MAGQVDFKGRIKKPLELAAGGYISVLDRNGRWTQIAAQGNRQRRSRWEAGGNDAIWGKRSGGSLLPAPAHSILGDFDQQPGGGQFSADGV